MGKGFRLILAVAAISICAGVVVGGNQPAAAGEMTPQTEKLFRAVRSNDFPAVKRNLLDGGDVRAENAAGLTVIDLAIDKGYFKIAHYLLAWRKQRKPKPKIPLPLPAPPPITAEAAPTVEPASPEPAREVAPKAPSAVGPVSSAEMNAKPTPTPTMARAIPEPLPDTAAVTPLAEKAAEIPPPAPVKPGPKAPDPKPLAEESRPAPEKAPQAAQPLHKPESESPSVPVPETAPEPEKAAEGPGVFDNIVGFFTSEPETSKPESLSGEVGKEPKNEIQGVSKASTPPPEKPEDRSGIIARIQDMLSIGPEKEAPPASRPGETASIPLSAPAPRPIPEPTPPGSPGVQTPAVPKTTSIEPFIGTSMKLGKRWRKNAARTCVSKPSRKRLFCIEPVDWPREIGPSFQVRTTLYRGRKSIVRYDGEVATQFHTFFPTGNFDVIVEHFSKLFGPPSETPVIWTVMIGKPNRKNRTARWVGPQRAGGKNGDQGAAPGILEVREIDDLRWSSPPDDRHGVVWLYRQGGLPVFRHVSWSDFLLARVRRQGK